MLKENKNILVIWASTGIGRELVKELILQKYRVWGVARQMDALESLKNEINQPDNFYISQVDITKKESIIELTKELKTKFVPQIIIINAGTYQNDMNDNINPEITDQMIETNYKGAINCVHHLLPITSKNGQFITISSSYAFKGSAHEGAGYAASKAAISIAFESFYLKWSQNGGPMFTTIFFGPLDTDLRRNKGSHLF